MVEPGESWGEGEWTARDLLRPSNDAPTDLDELPNPANQESRGGDWPGLPFGFVLLFALATIMLCVALVNR